MNFVGLCAERGRSLISLMSYVDCCARGFVTTILARGLVAAKLVDEAGESDGERLQAAERIRVVARVQILVDLSELHSDVVGLLWMHELEVLGWADGHASVEVEHERVELLVPVGLFIHQLDDVGARRLLRRWRGRVRQSRHAERLVIVRMFVVLLLLLLVLLMMRLWLWLACDRIAAPRISHVHVMLLPSGEQRVRLTLDVKLLAAKVLVHAWVKMVYKAKHTQISQTLNRSYLIFYQRESFSQIRQLNDRGKLWEYFNNNFRVKSFVIFNLRAE